MPRPARSAALALLLPILAGCQPPSSQRTANRSLVADCRVAVDRVYAAQNRVDLSRQDERDEPFAAQYVSGVVTSGLSARYGRDRMVDSCVKENGGPAQVPDSGTGTAFSPTSPARP